MFTFDFEGPVESDTCLSEVAVSASPLHVFTLFVQGPPWPIQSLRATRYQLLLLSLLCLYVSGPPLSLYHLHFIPPLYNYSFYFETLLKVFPVSGLGAVLLLTAAQKASHTTLKVSSHCDDLSCSQTVSTTGGSCTELQCLKCESGPVNTQQNSTTLGWVAVTCYHTHCFQSSSESLY